MKKEPVFVTGHQNPDTDSVVSAIAYAFFKRARGIPAVACRLGKLNAETMYLLERFHYQTPSLLSDARVCVGDIAMDPPHSLHADATVYECLQKMKQENRTYCGITDQAGRLIGMSTKSDISVIGLYDTVKAVDILSRTPLENYRKTLNGRIVYQEPDMKLNGKVSVIAMTQPDNLAKYDVSGRIVICGDDCETQKHIIQMGAGLLVVVWTNQVDETVVEMARKFHCSILISGHGAMNTIRYVYFAPSVSQIMKTDLICFSDQELAEDVGRKMIQSRHRVYPVLDSEGRPLGYVSRYHIMQAKNKKIILVDHNEFSQSVKAIEKAQVLEVIDHHRINDFSSTSPVQFRNEIVGSTATIVATIFRENQIPISENLAGLMLGAIISDTLFFHSPTTTPKDKDTANILAAIADLDQEEFARDIFRQSAQTASLSPAELIRGDLKFFEINHCHISISQVIIPSIEDMPSTVEEIQRQVNIFSVKKKLDLAVLAFTSVMDNGSILFFGGERAPWGKEAFPEQNDQEFTFHNNVLSRKQQILPQITAVILKYS